MTGVSESINKWRQNVTDRFGAFANVRSPDDALEISDACLLSVTNVADGRISSSSLMSGEIFGRWLCYSKNKMKKSKQVSEWVPRARKMAKLTTKDNRSQQACCSIAGVTDNLRHKLSLNQRFMNLSRFYQRWPFRKLWPDIGILLIGARSDALFSPSFTWFAIDKIIDVSTAELLIRHALSSESKLTFSIERINFAR